MRTRLLSRITAVLLSVLLFAIFISCGSEPSGDKGGSVDLKCSVGYSGNPAFTLEDEFYYTDAVDVTFTVNRTADLSFYVYYIDNKTDHLYENGKKYSSKGTSAKVTCDASCNISFYASNGSSSTFGNASVRMANLEKVMISAGGGDFVSDGTLELLKDSWLFLYFDMLVLPESLTTLPTIRYTTDGSDPNESETATEIQLSREEGLPLIQFNPETTRFRAYAELAGWNSSPETDVVLKIAKTVAPVLEPEGDVLPYGDQIMVTSSGNAWYTTDQSIAVETIDENEPGDDPASGWVPVINGSIPVPEKSGGIDVRVVALENGKNYSDVVERSYQVKLPKPTPVGSPSWKENGKMKVLFSRGNCPSDSNVICNYEVAEEGNGIFSVTANSGSTITIQMEKDGYLTSDEYSGTFMLQLHEPTSSIGTEENFKYKLVTLTTNDSNATICFILDGVESEYKNPIEIRENSTISFWTKKAKYIDSEVVSIKVSIKYEIGDRGPSGGIVIHDAGYELYPRVFSNLMFGYYSKKDGVKASKVFSTDNSSDSSIGVGKTNTDQLVQTMTGHAYSTSSCNSSDRISNNNFLAYVASQFSVTRTINGKDRTFKGWYVPSKKEMEMIFDRIMDPDLSSVDFSWFNPELTYWTSTENNSTMAYYVKRINNSPSSGTTSKSFSYPYVLMRKI